MKSLRVWSSLWIEGKKQQFFLSVIQYFILVLSLLVGVFLAHHRKAWFTFSGSLVGAIAAFLIVHLGQWLFSLQWMRKVSNAFFDGVFRKSLASWSLFVSEAFVEERKRIVSLWKSLWQILYEMERKHTISFVLMALLKSPLRFGTWLVVGQVIATIVKMKGSANEALLSRNFDLYLGLFIAPAIVQFYLTRRASKLSRKSSAGLERGLVHLILQRSILPGCTEHQSALKLSELQRSVQKSSYSISRFTISGAQALDVAFNLCILVGVLFFISVPAAGIVLGAITIHLVGQLMSLPRDSEELLAIRAGQARFKSLSELASQSSFQTLCRFVNQREVTAAHLRETEEEVRLPNEVNERGAQQREDSSAIVFFAFFGLASTFPLLEAANGNLSIRVALLFFFSIHTAWGAISTLSERLEEVSQNFLRLENIEELLQITGEPELEEHRLLPLPEVPLEQVSSSVLVDSFSVSFPFTGKVLECVGGLTRPLLSVAPTVTDAQVVKVIGAGGAGTTTLLRALSGQWQPERSVNEDTGEILLHGVDPSAVQVGQYSPFEYDLSSAFLVIPDLVPSIERVRVSELFRFFSRVELSDKDIRKVLRLFGLMDDFDALAAFDTSKKIGHELLLGTSGYGKELSEVQRRKLFYALHYMALKDCVQTPKVLAVDGVQKLPMRADRQLVTSIFKKLCDELHVTLFVTERDGEDLKGDDNVLCLLTQDEVSPDAIGKREPDDDSLLVIGGKHREQFESPNRFVKGRYRKFLAAEVARY